MSRYINYIIIYVFTVMHLVNPLPALRIVVGAVQSMDVGARSASALGRGAAAPRQATRGAPAPLGRLVAPDGSPRPRDRLSHLVFFLSYSSQIIWP